MYLRQNFIATAGILILAVLLLGLSQTVFAARDKVVAIDIGHTVKKSGATSARGVSEFDFNQNIAEQLLVYLQAHGINKAFVINPDGDAIKLSKRTAIAAEKQADVFVSIHHDSMQLKYLKKWTYQGEQYLYSEKFEGYSLFISQKTKDKKANTALAYSLGDQLLNDGFTPSLHHAEPIKGENRRLINAKHGIYEFPELAVLRTAKMPAILIECGIIVNRDEEARLSDPQYQEKLVDAIGQGILKFLQESQSD